MIVYKPDHALRRVVAVVMFSSDANVEKIHWLETQLASDTYRHIEEKHRRKMIEHRTTEMAVTDLDKYWTALDKVCCSILRPSISSSSYDITTLRYRDVPPWHITIVSIDGYLDILSRTARLFAHRGSSLHGIG